MSCPLLLPLLPSFTSFPHPTSPLSSSMPWDDHLSSLSISPRVPVKPMLTGPSLIHHLLSHFMILLLFPIRSSGTVSSKEERTGSITASHGRRGWTSFICIYTASSLVEKEGVKDEELEGKVSILVQKCLFGGFSYRYFIFTSFLMAKKEKRVLLRVCVYVYPALSFKCIKCTAYSRLLSHRVGCQILSPQWFVGRGGDRWEEASSWSDIGT